MTTDVLIVGAGSSGLVLAIELARRGKNFRLIDRLSKPFDGSRGKGLQPRTLEIFHDLGVIDQIAEQASPYPPVRQYEGQVHRDVIAPSAPAVPGEPYPVSLMIPQWKTEDILRNRLHGLGGLAEFDTELVAIRTEDDGVVATVRTSNGVEEIPCRYLVGADGGRSTVRKLLGIDFPGEARPFKMIVADLPVQGLSRDFWHRWKDAPGGQFALCPLAGTSLFQLAAEVAPDAEPDVSADALHELIRERTGRTDLMSGEPSWTSIYRVNFRLAESYRVGNAFIIGDAAHVHPPTGGQGLNTSVQDAFNLGWKLAAALGGAPTSLLDSYEEERRTIAADVLEMSAELLTAMTARGDMHRGRNTLQLDLHYRASPLSFDGRHLPGKIQAGDRAPDATVLDAQGKRRHLFDLFAHPGFSILSYGSGVDLGSLVGRPGIICFHVDDDMAMLTDDRGEVRERYGLEAPTLLLIRPDGYVAAAADRDRPQDIHEWLSRWTSALLPESEVTAQ